ncbi:hypothetical protein M5J06_09140 [Corynebacterium sp. B5-R-101]|uniref:Uncharacterized protein n=1 Tax=Corynebacterium intestinale TaxID=2943492 RepID=A0ABT0TB62_9CORY|nr:hypothetical protein [Corynebacterium intestinale]MCL8494287.1 hypothetical protein [Corynebacterium intestinale]MCP1390523.1 hypothetical protein [Corynebacterium intestinale]
MNLWHRRDALLKTIVQSHSDIVHFSDLRQHCSLRDQTPSLLQSDLHWLGQRGFIDTFDSAPGDISTIRAQPLGIDLVEHEISIESASYPSNKRINMESQINFNSGNAINIQGNHNSVNQSNENSLAEQAISALQENGEPEKADQLLELHEKEGAAAAFKQAFSWITDKVLAPSASAALVPVVTKAISMF